MQLQIEGFSKDMRYIFTNKGVVRLSEQLNDMNGENYATYTLDNLNVAIEILKENFAFEYLNNKISLQEFSASSRKFINYLMEILLPDNRISVLKEWEQKSGGQLILLNESVENGLVLEQVMNSWDYINIILEEKGVWDTLKGWGKSAVEAGKGIVKSISGMASSVWDTVKNKVSSAFKCVAQNPMACIMEFIRAALFSPVVTGGLTALAVAVPGIGSAPDIIMYGALFIWDTYKLLSGGYETGEYAFSWGDLLLDIVGMAIPLLAGTLFKTIGNTVFKNLGDLVRWLSSKGGVISKVVNILTNQLQKILSGISSAASWLGSKLGLTVLQNFSSKATQMAKTLSSDFIKLAKPATKAISKAGTSAGQAVSNVAKKALSTKTGSALTAGAVSGGVNTAFCAAMGYDLITCKEKTESGEITPDMESEAESEARILAALRAATEAENRNT